ncbi:uncharacterized protein LOC110106591 [Dendrobium catenatum]|uniref:Methyltransferase FkbM domain-containing protein n=1 Tax=Dendrobium catenatum TaxID=906689 RepID=A0A2I0W1U9_9ASPA|nr:uncharacterized protein LOC110106591 [Dendrobium catenatum]PKU69636.1 hypothetical protein MA16_Dca012971 [Dendrobium catenatum]
MPNAWKKEKASPLPLSFRGIFLLLVLLFFLLILIFFRPLFSQNPNRNPISLHFQIPTLNLPHGLPLLPFDCAASPQASPVFAARVEGLHYPFLYSLADFGSLPEKPHKNIVRMMKGKPFRRPEISSTIQEFLHGSKPTDGIVIDVGANVGMATFAAAAMGFRVVAFEPVFENLQRICDGVFLNRVWDRVVIFEAAASDRLGNITLHKLVGRLDNSAISATGAKLAFKSNKEIAIEVKTIPLDLVIPDNEKVLLIKIDVQGWELHVLEGAIKLLSRTKGEAPYLIYEEDERLLAASNSSRKEIREFLRSVGYDHCTQHGTDAHCTKN